MFPGSMIREGQQSVWLSCLGFAEWGVQLDGKTEELGTTERIFGALTKKKDRSNSSESSYFHKGKKLYRKKKF